MDRDHGFAKSNLKVLVSVLVGFSMAGCWATLPV